MSPTRRNAGAVSGEQHERPLARPAGRAEAGSSVSPRPPIGRERRSPRAAVGFDLEMHKSLKRLLRWRRRGNARSLRRCKRRLAGSTRRDGKSLANPGGGAYVGLVAFGSFPRHRPRSNRLNRRFDPGNQGGKDPTRGRMTALPSPYLRQRLLRARRSRPKRGNARRRARVLRARPMRDDGASKGAPRMATRQCSAEFQGRNARVA